MALYAVGSAGILLRPRYGLFCTEISRVLRARCGSRCGTKPRHSGTKHVVLRWWWYASVWYGNGGTEPGCSGTKPAVQNLRRGEAAVGAHEGAAPARTSLDPRPYTIHHTP
eukprot:785926-Rhodomonas_salina.1